MTVITITRRARCKDCKFLKPSYHGKRKYHDCTNEKSDWRKQRRSPKDYVCDKWQMI